MIASHQNVLRIAAEAMVDPRTVRRYLAGNVVRPMSRERIESAARTLGLAQVLTESERSATDSYLDHTADQ